MKYLIVFFLLFHFSSHSNSQDTGKLTIYFAFNDYRLDSKAKNKIDSCIENKIINEVFINAHCDSVSGNAYNDNLSLNRAKEVKRYLLSKQISESIIKLNASGKRVPLNKNENESARALNRRAEITFTFKNSSPQNKSIDKNTTDPENISDEGSSKNSITDESIHSNLSDAFSKDSSVLNIKNIEVGSSLRLPNINFEGGRHIMLPGGTKTLKRLFNTMNSNPSLVIELQGHVCCVNGNSDGLDRDTHTWNLSVNRAKVIYEFLLENGIAPSRVSYKGFGGSQKLVREITEADRTMNRRVEIKILKK